jgi:hypothetical protein
LGFGDVLSRISVSDQLGGEIARDWRPEGLAIRLSVPRQRLEAWASADITAGAARARRLLQILVLIPGVELLARFILGDSISLLDYALELLLAAESA